MPTTLDIALSGSFTHCSVQNLARMLIHYKHRAGTRWSVWQTPRRTHKTDGGEYSAATLKGFNRKLLLIQLNHVIRWQPQTKKYKYSKRSTEHIYSSRKKIIPNKVYNQTAWPSELESSVARYFAFSTLVIIIKTESNQNAYYRPTSCLVTCTIEQRVCVYNPPTSPTPNTHE